MITQKIFVKVFELPAMDKLLYKGQKGQQRWNFKHGQVKYRVWCLPTCGEEKIIVMS